MAEFRDVIAVGRVRRVHAIGQECAVDWNVRGCGGIGLLAF